SYPPLTRRVLSASALVEVRPRLIWRHMRGNCLGRRNTRSCVIWSATGASDQRDPGRCPRRSFHCGGGTSKSTRGDLTLRLDNSSSCPQVLGYDLEPPSARPMKSVSRETLQANRHHHADDTATPYQRPSPTGLLRRRALRSRSHAMGTSRNRNA